MKRRLLIWRVVAIAAVLAVGAIAIGKRDISGSTAHVARVRISGEIGEDRKLIEAILALAKDDSAKAVILAINSPGGSVGASEALHTAISLLAQNKPVVAVMGSVAASGGYMAAVAAQRILARQSTITGSIGVIGSNYVVSDLLAKVGVSPETFRSGEMKDQPSITHPISPEGRVVFQGIIQDLYEQFLDKVAAGRKMDRDKLRALADGRIYTGRQAVANGLVDAIGGEPDAREWLASTRDVPKSLPIRDVEKLTGWEKLVGQSAEEIFQGILKTLFSQRVSLDGPMAIWQPFDTKG